MAAREGFAADDGFVPFEPRRHYDAKAHHAEPSIAPEMEHAESQPDEAPDRETAGATNTTAIETSVDQDQQASLEPALVEPQPPTVAAPPSCDHALAIRNEAIRLASIACGRALRHAAVIHPRTIAAFVDDALAAAGNPRHARIWLHPDAGTQRDVDHEQIWDAELEPGDVIVEHEGVMLRADLESRAALLVRAAADR